MTDLELIFTMLGERVTTEISQKEKPDTFDENKKVARRGGNVAGVARRETEKELGLKHLCYMRGYKNVINKQKELNSKGIVAPLAMETSGHGALKDNYFLDDGAFLAVKMIIALARAAKEGKKLDSLIEKLPPLVEEGEYRFKINTEDFKAYGKNVLEEFKKRASAAGYEMPESYEGIRLSFKGEDVQGWILLRMSLHDPVMPMNIEGGRKGDLAKLIEIAKKLTDGFDKLDRKF